MALSHRKKLFFFTEWYPWGTGEKTFVVPEIHALISKYDVVVVSAALGEILQQPEYVSKIPDGASLVHVARPNKIQKFLLALSMPFTKIGREELKDLMGDGLSFARLKNTLGTYSKAKHLLKAYNKHNVFRDIENSIYYPFWLHEQALALALQKEYTPEIKIISRLNGFDLYNERVPSGRQPFQRVIKRRVNKLAFTSKYGLNYFKTHFGDEEYKGQYFVNYLGAYDCGQNAPLSTSDEHLVVSCSNVIPLKRVHLICDAIAKISNIKVKWIHFGTGTDLNSLQARAKSLKLNCELRGYHSLGTIMEFYKNNAIDVFVTATSTEGGCPVSIQEAMSAGIPIVATSVGGIPEMIDGNGILLDANPTASDIAQAILEILNDEETRLAMSKRSRELWSTHFNPYQNKQKLIECIENL